MARFCAAREVLLHNHRLKFRTLCSSFIAAPPQIMAHHKSLLLLFLALLVAFDLASGADCGDKTSRNFDVATTCEADFSEGVEICPADCEPKMRAYIEDCSPTMAELSFLVIATDGDACFDIVFGIFADQRGSDCELNKAAQKSMWPVVCLSSCTEKCIDIVEGVCTHCDGVLESDFARQTETELTMTATHCPQRNCVISSSGSSSSGGSSSSSSSGGSGSSSSSSSSSGGQARGGTRSLASSSIVVSLAFVWWTVSSSSIY